MAYTTIDKPSDYFNTKLYSGTGSTNAITGVGFQPDWVWIKARDHAYGHHLQDAVRGTGKDLYSNLSDAEYSNANSLTTFGSDGFTVGSDNGVNNGSKTYVSWNWLGANGTASNTDGSITSTVSANTTAGFSIVSYTGTGSNATVGHGLGVAPKMIICKGRSFSSSAHWLTYHEAMGNTSAMKLNLTSAKETTHYYWNNTSPTSSTFSLGAGTEANTSSATFIAYCFAEKKGYSKFGSYTGNGNADGTFVYTGFKPAFVLIKSTSNAVNWQMQDNKTAPHNLMVNKLFANTSAAQDTGSENTMDFYSNGFKPRGTGSSENINGNGYSYIYMAFAENPFVTSTGIPSCAR